VTTCASAISYEYDGMIGIAPRALVAYDIHNLGPAVGFMD